VIGADNAEIKSCRSSLRPALMRELKREQPSPSAKSRVKAFLAKHTLARA
jgi:hypothetical protein